MIVVATVDNAGRTVSFVAQKYGYALTIET